jgi:hypothetical protein
MRKKTPADKTISEIHGIHTHTPTTAAQQKTKKHNKTKAKAFVCLLDL